MTKTSFTSSVRCILLIIPFLFFSCVDKKAPEFPYDKKYSVKPTTKSFEFSKPDTLVGKSYKAKSYDQLPANKFSWDKLESQKLEIGFPYEANLPLPVNDLQFDSLPYVDFDISDYQEEKLAVRVIALGEPEIKEAGNLVTGYSSTRGVRAVDDNFGITGDVTASIVDSKGNIWMGTNNGSLVQYDSHYIKTYSSLRALEIDDILSILEDSQGRIWISSFEGKVFVLDLKSYLVYELKSSNMEYRIFDLEEMKDGNIWFRNNRPGYSFINFDKKSLTVLGNDNGPFGPFSIVALEDREGLIWMTSVDGVQILDREKKKMSRLNVDQGLLSSEVYNLFEDDRGRIWIATGEGVSIVSADRKSIESMSSKEGLNGLIQVFAVIQESESVYWIGTGNSLLFRFDERTGLLEKYKLVDSSQLYMFEILKDNQGQIWSVAAQGGMFAIDRGSGQPANIDEADGLEENEVWATVVDSIGRIWIGTYEGINVYYPDTQILKKFTTDEGLAHNFTNNLFLDEEGKIWVAGGREGVSIIDPNNETIRILSVKDDLKGHRARYINQDNQGNMWFAADQGVFSKYEPENAKVTIYSDSLETALLTSIELDGEQNVWLGSQGSGLQRFNPKTYEREWIRVENGLVSNNIYALDVRDEGIMWVAGGKGVEKIDLNNSEISLFTTNQGLLAADTYDIKELNGKVYAGTSQGVSILERNSVNEDSWEVYSVGKDQGMLEFDISQNSFSFDSEERLWAGSNGIMLSVIDPVQKDTANYPVSIIGINVLDKPYNFFNKDDIDNALLSHDSIWVWEDNKLRLMNEKERDSLSSYPTGTVWDDMNDLSNLPVGLTLNYNQNFMNFSYQAGQFKNKESIQFSYILEGIDKSWSPLTKEAISENYRDLPPGNYTFKVAAKGYNNIWSDPAEFSFTILPPWWKTSWAYAIYILLLGGVIYAFVQYRSRWLKRENRLLEERVNQRTAQLKKTIDELETTQGQLIQSEKMASLGELTAGIAHEIQNPMNFINNFSEVSHELLDEMMEEVDKGDMEEAKEISNDIKQNLEKISHHGHRASSIVRGMLEHSRNSSGQKEDIDINVLADEYLRLAYHGLRAKDKSFNAKFETDFDDSIGKIEIIPQDIGRVMLNLINNAFYAVSDRADKESDESYQPTVKVTTQKMKDQVKITVEDNGSGIPQEIKDKIFQPFFTTKPSGKGTGLGLSLTYDIITQGHSGALELDSEVGKGTIFTIFLPVKQ